ncbi:hypothetical protein [Tahibacter amnicola]|uniref:Uncharacterized protein n=1 Tax=Tahibacter amnicola TaxID=2976241 RepID=A0ABY6B9K6_9GAMM|nr:hypothetical protein [Tahibacter amnicola]UXI66709.1 hypothetical protein N4264_18410 [Tahibacter amnicola]
MRELNEIEVGQVAGGDGDIDICPPNWPWRWPRPHHIDLTRVVQPIGNIAQGGFSIGN